MEADDPTQVVVSHRPQQPELAGEGAGVGDRLAISRDEGRPLRHLLEGGVRDTDHDDLVVGEQFLVDGLREREPVQHRAELLLVVHRGDLPVSLTRLLPQPPRVVARRGRHEQPLPRLDLGGVEHGREHPGLGASAAVRLVRNHQIEQRRPARLGVCDPLRRLIGREHDPRPTAALAKERCNLNRVGGDGDAEFARRCDDGVPVLGCDRVVGADRQVVEVPDREPLADRLLHQRQRRHQHKGSLRPKLVVQETGSQRLAGAARHHQLAAITVGQTRDHVLHGIVADAVAASSASHGEGRDGRWSAATRSRLPPDQSAGSCRQASPDGRACDELSARDDRWSRSAADR